MDAIIHGFLGRKNTGDDMMLWMHVLLLSKLGAKKIALSTEGADTAMTVKLQWQARIISKEFKIECRFVPGWEKTDLLITGGGSIPVGFGTLQMCFNKTFPKTINVLSSVNISFHPVFQTEFEAVTKKIVDFSIIRNDKSLGFGNVYRMPDISCAYRADQLKKINRLAVVVRHKNIGTAIQERIAPTEDFDVICLSETDRAMSKQYADKWKVPIIDFTDCSPFTQCDELCRYKGVLSMGRLHPAIYAKSNKIPSIFFDCVPKYNIDKYSAGRLEWEQLQKMSKDFEGGKDIVFENSYPMSIDDYVDVFRKHL